MTDIQANFTNQQLSDTFRLIAELLEIKGEVIYKTLAYRKAAESLSELPRDVKDVWREGKLTEIPGVGKAIAEKIDELFTTGKLVFLERLKTEVPETLVELLQVQDVGPKKAALFWRQLGVTSLAELKEAAVAGKLRTLPGMGEKSELRILAGIEAAARRGTRIPLGKAWPFAQELLAVLRKTPGVKQVEAAGSLRRMRVTVGDLDLAAAADDAKAVMDALASRSDVLQVISRGETKISLEFEHQMRLQLWVYPPERFGAGWLYATGSKDHNVRLRELALKQGLSLSDQSFLCSDGSEILCAAEEEVYATLGLPWIPPELREDRGEVQAARKGELPELIRMEDLRSELHSHSQWSDGKVSIRTMAEAARARGLKALAITDHSVGLGVAGGISGEDLRRQRTEIVEVQRELGDSIRLLQGCEVEIRADGTLDFPDEVLAELDIVIASLHSGLRQSREQVTQRTLSAIRNPHVDIIGHPTGRLVQGRDGADLDLEAVFAEATAHHVALEINSIPARMDLDDVNARRAAELGILLSVNTDAHDPRDLENTVFGVSVARRAGLVAGQVINTWEPERLLDWLRNRSSQ